VTPPLWREALLGADVAALLRDPVLRGAGVPRGDGRPVILIPGFLAGDASLDVMTRWLRRRGYWTWRSGIRRNVDCATATIDRLEPRVEEIAARRGRRVALVGQSRGGSLARGLAQRRPDLVSGVIALGSPLRDELATHPFVRAQVTVVGLLGTLGARGLFGRSCLDGDCCAELRESAERDWPDDVGFVSVYSKTDGIVDWRSCLHPAAEHVRVTASHIGMAMSPGTLRAVASALPTFAP
jgi:pimeloyl-ACP methyl ester carboxylesterase